MLLPRVLLVLALGFALPAAAAPKKDAAPTPKELGQFGRWIAATFVRSGQTVCYAFTRAGTEDPATGTGPILSVTDRPGGRDEVAISGGPTWPKGAPATVQVDPVSLDFYTSGRDAFAHDNKAAVAAFVRGASATLKEPGTKGTLTFSLDGFTAAHDAIEKACPAR